MAKKVISSSHKITNGLDNDYTLFEDGTVLHEYDKHIYPGGFNLKDNLKVDDLSDDVKKRLYESASDDNKELVRRVLKLS